MPRFSFRALKICMVISITIICIIFLYMDNMILFWDKMPSYAKLLTKIAKHHPEKNVHSVHLLTNYPHEVSPNKQSPVIRYPATQLCSSIIEPDVANITTLNILYNLDTNWDTTDFDTGQRGSSSKLVSPNKPLTVIVVPHSHNDPGWLNTVDEYFSEKTKYILDGMLQKLVKYPNMTFVWAETIFLSMWWKGLTPEQQETLKLLINRRQLEIVGGGWVVPDEANTHYFALIEQMTLGHEWLGKTLNVKPTNTWALDPFGYSMTMPYLYKRSGLKNMLILRVHKQVKIYLAERRQLEFFWQQPWHPSLPTKIFTHMMPYKLYNIEHTCGPNKTVCKQFDFVDPDNSVNKRNINHKAHQLLRQYRQKAHLFRHGVLLVPLGDDFRYDKTSEWDMQYKNYMRLFNYINMHQEFGVNIKFGTVADYFNEIHKKKTAQSFPTLSGDFFPYTDDSYQYWTGYFTTRPYLKLVGRTLEARLRAADILQSLAGAYAITQRLYYPQFHHNTHHLLQIRRSLALFQHHDAITGTSKLHVSKDYLNRLLVSLKYTDSVSCASASFLLSQRAKAKKIVLSVPHINNKHLYPDDGGGVIAVKGEPVELILFNSIPQQRQELVTVIVDTDHVMVSDETGKPIVSQLNPVWTARGVIDTRQFELVFLTGNLPALGLTTYMLRHVDNPEQYLNFASSILIRNGDEESLSNMSRFKLLPRAQTVLALENEYYLAQFSIDSGSLVSITTKHKSRMKTMRCGLRFLMYKSRGSGAYIFQPFGPPLAADPTSKKIIRVIQGSVVSDVSVIGDFIEHSVSLINTTSPLGAALFIRNIVNLQDAKDKELIMRLSSELHDDNDTFYTDLNGFQMAQRHRFSNLPREANYYPVTTAAYLEDSWSRLTLLAAQSLGVGSQASGQLEVMLDRHLLYDDQRGLAEGIVDNQRTVSRFALLIEHRVAARSSMSTPSLLAHSITSLLQQPALIMLKTDYHSGAGRTSSYKPLLTTLPSDIKLVNLRSTAAPGHHRIPAAALILHRVVPDCSFPRTSLDGDSSLQLATFLRNIHPSNISEMTLSMMYAKRHLKYKERVQLKPMEIYAFKLEFTIQSNSSV